jgi:uncharacterized membrane protein YgcG
MKTPDFKKSLMATAAVLLAIFAGNAVAQDSPAYNVAQPAAASQSAPPQLSYGVPQVLQLAQAKVGDDTIVAYIQNSGTIYTLDASQIIYLRQQGVSDSVVTAMLNQRKNVTASAAQTVPQPSTAAPPVNDPSYAGSAQTSTAVAQPTVNYVQTVPSSSVYVVPDTQTYNYDAYYYQPYYYPYYAWPYSPVLFSFGFGGGFHGGGGGFRGGGGFHGGGGGFHGGGSHH